MKKPSELYQKILHDGIVHQNNSRTWSGGLAVRHAPRIKEFIKRIGAKSALDYGCGKGVQYMHEFEGKRLEDWWGIPVYKYDPAVRPGWKNNREKFAHVTTEVHCELPAEGSWDLLICTHVMGCIPEIDLRGWVIPDIFHKRIKKGMYFAENVQQATKQVIRDEADREANGPMRTPQQWIDLVKCDHLEMEFWFRGHDPDRLGARFEKWPFSGQILT